MTRSPQALGAGSSPRGSSPSPEDQAERVRLFVALELPGRVRAALARWCDRLGQGRAGSLRPVDEDALHVTLCFLGWRSADEVEAIAAACAVIGSEPAPELALGSGIWLPPRRPRVLAVELSDPDTTLTRIQASLSQALAAGGWYEPEKRPYLAHVTVARVRAGGRTPREDLPEPPRLAFRASRVVLYRSRLSRSGARYDALASVELTRHRRQ